MIDIRDPHSDVLSEHVALSGEHPGRAANPIVKVYDVAWLEFEKPYLERTERFAEAFGFTTALRTAHELIGVVIARDFPPDASAFGNPRKRSCSHLPYGCSCPASS
jgi:hypothetical protein